MQFARALPAMHFDVTAHIQVAAERCSNHNRATDGARRDLEYSLSCKVTLPAEGTAQDQLYVRPLSVILVVSPSPIFSSMTCRRSKNIPD